MSVITGFVCFYEKGVKNVCPFLSVAEKEEYKKGHVFADKNSQKKARNYFLSKFAENKLFFFHSLRKKYISVEVFNLY